MIFEKQIQLKNKLKNIITEVGHDNNIKKDIQEEFKSRNLDSLRVAKAFNENLDLDTLTDSDNDIMFLFLFSFALNKALKSRDNSTLEDYKNYFTPIEISQWENFKQEVETEDIFPYTFYNVDEIIPGRCWQTKQTAQEVERLNKADILIYNINSQRGLKITKKRFGIDEDPNKVKEIAEGMESGKQFPDDLKYNILKGEGEPPDYNKKLRTLTIQSDNVLNIFDGQHRKSANALVISKFPDIEFTWPVKITYLSEIEAHNVMVQIDKQKPINKSVISTKDYSKNENLVIDKIMDSGGDLANVAKDTDSFVKNNRGLVTKLILAEAIKDNYGGQLKLDMNRKEIASWIVEFTNRLMGIYSEEFISNPYEIKKTNYINNLHMFYGYIALSAKLKDNNDWKEILKQKIESIDFNINNPIWKEIGLNGENHINKTTKNKLYKLFREV